MRLQHASHHGPYDAPDAARDVENPRAAQPLRRGRTRAAEIFDAVLRARVEREDYSASNCAIASKLGVTEKQIREYRAGLKSLPLGALLEMPRSVAVEVMRRSLAAIAQGGASIDAQAAMMRLGAAMGEVCEALSKDDHEAARARLCRLVEIAESMLVGMR